MRFSRLFFFLVVLVCTFEFFRLGNITPPQMAVHFDIAGNPDRYVWKPEFFTAQAQTLLTVILISMLVHLLSLVVPGRYTNMPYRDYWLSPVRNDGTLARIRSFGLNLFAVILLAIQAAFELAAYANLQEPKHFNFKLMFLVMIVAFAVIGILLFQLIRSFRVPSSGDGIA